MTAYIDTSALAKWYIAEAKSDEFADFIAGVDDAVTSRLTVVEMRCLLARQRRASSIPRTIEMLAYQRFSEQIGAGYVRIEPVPDRRLLEALALIEQLPDIPLRTLDAIHLAAAVAAQATLLATADDTQRRAAVMLGLEVAYFGSAMGEG